MNRIDFILKRLADESEREWGYCSHRDEIEWLLEQLRISKAALADIAESDDDISAMVAATALVKMCESGSQPVEKK